MGRSPTILYVDDDRQNRETYGLIFRQAGFDVKEAATGDEALRLAALNPDLVVMDVNLPDMNGYEVCRRIKTHPATTAIPVLHLSTVFVNSQDRTHSMEEGADAHLTKPVEPEELLAHVKALLRIRQAEEALREAARQWQTTFDTASDAVCLLDRAGKILRANKAMAALLGLPFSEILGRPYILLIRSALDGGAVPDLTRVHKSGERECLELGCGGRWFHMTADPVFDDKSRVTGSVHILADISEFKRSEKERVGLLADRARLADHLRLLLESTGEGVFGLDRQGKCTFINRAAAAMLGVNAEEFVGQNAHERTHHSHADGSPYPEVECPIYLAVQSGKGCRVDSEVMWRADGTCFPAEYSAHPIRTRHGGICGAVVTFTDITHRKLLELELRQAQKLEAVGRLAGGVAHDFNNLMAVVSGNVSVLLAGVSTDSPQYAALRAIDQAAWRAAELTRRLLGFSRKSKLWLRPVDLRRSFEEIVALLKRTIDPRIVIEVHQPPDLWPAMADLGQINQVLMNLCLNARDAMPEGGRLGLQADNITLDDEQAARHAEARAGDFIRLRVVDTGRGIPAHILPHIFEPFFTTKEPGKGTGLGLAMVFGIIKQHHGWLTVRSEANQGTCFDLFIPRSDTTILAATPPPTIPILPIGGSENILVVDDEPMIRTLARKILTTLGYHAYLARDGQEAIDGFRRHQGMIDLILLDLTMPRISGRDALQQIRKIDPYVPIVYMSGYATTISEATNDPVQGFLQKPFHANDLARVVRMALDGVRRG
jgi:PAS domain S-box-containing protein